MIPGKEAKKHILEKNKAATSTNGVGKAFVHMQKCEIKSISITLPKITFKWIKEPKLKHETRKMIEGRIERTLQNIPFRKDFLNRNTCSKE